MAGHNVDDRSHPYSDGPMELPYQRPSKQCRTFESELVEKIIKDMNASLVDRDLARLFENAFPNTLDTTVRWHQDGSSKHEASKMQQILRMGTQDAWEGAQSFIVTGDINAEWLRDSTNQLAQYQRLAKKDKRIENLILGAINTQAEYVIESPYCKSVPGHLRHGRSSSLLWYSRCLLCCADFDKSRQCLSASATKQATSLGQRPVR